MNAMHELIHLLNNEAAFFESLDAQNRFLHKVLNALRLLGSAKMVAIFTQAPGQDSLSLRAAVDEGGNWNTKLFEGPSKRLRFSLEDEEIRQAFSENRVLRFIYKAVKGQAVRQKLVVPISKGPLRMGLLVLAREATDELDENDLLTLASELGEILEDSSLLLARTSTLRELEKGQAIRGKRASEGRVIGRALPFWDEAAGLAKEIPGLGSPEAELERFEHALSLSVAQLEELQNLKQGFSDMGANIFLAHSLMIKDEGFTSAIRSRIMEGFPGPQAILYVVKDYARRFAQIAEARIAEKAQDVRDLGFRLIRNLVSRAEEGFSYEGRIALAGQIFPSDLMRLAMQGISGIVLYGAGLTAHISILAKSLDIPVLITDDRALFGIPEGTELLLDASRATLLVRPSATQIKEHKEHGGEGTRFLRYSIRGLTSDGTHVQVAANVNIMKDAEEARRQGAEGIGLYRSEFPFILKNDFLTDEQQYHIYRAICSTQKGKPVILRTADIGGDKLMQGRGKAEDNPFLGVRGIRFSLANREMFGDQLRAMLRAGVGMDLGIMLPMVSSVEEVLEAKEEIARAAQELSSRGLPYNDRPKVGAMIELPSAALAVEELARETDFLSIGTNDLTMYLLAVDRTNEDLSHLYRSHHPSVLRVLDGILKDAGEKASNVSVCGDVASDPYLLPFFVGIGIRKLSVPPASVEPVKQMLKRFTTSQAREISREMLAIRRISEMEEYLKQFDRDHDFLVPKDEGRRMELSAI